MNLHKGKNNLKYVRVLFMLVILFLFISQPLIVTANDTVEEELEEVAIDSQDLLITDFVLSVRPEYDFPEGWRDQEVPAVLVIQIAKLENLSDEPIIRLSWPAPVSDPYFYSYAIGKMRTDVEGRFFPAQHVLGEDEIVIDLSEQPILPGEEYTLTVQYYYSPFEIEADNKTFEYTFLPNIDIESGRIEVVIPPAARNSRVMPVEYAMQGGKILQNINVDQAIEMTVSYVKDDNTPTNRTQSQTSSAGESSMLLGFLALMVIIVLVLFLFFKATDKKDNTSTKKMSSRKISDKKEQVSNKEDKQLKSDKKTGKKVDLTNKVNKKQVGNIASEEKKNLRKQLIAGEIDEENYRKEIAKL